MLRMVGLFTGLDAVLLEASLTGDATPSLQSWPSRHNHHRHLRVTSASSIVVLITFVITFIVMTSLIAINATDHHCPSTKFPRTILSLFAGPCANYYPSGQGPVAACTAQAAIHASRARHPARRVPQSRKWACRSPAATCTPFSPAAQRHLQPLRGTDLIILPQSGGATVG